MSEGVRQILATLEAAHDAVDVFGPLHSDEELRRAYRSAVMRCHPDHCPGESEAAREAFIRLNRWRAVAGEQLRAGTYGRPGAGDTDSPAARPAAGHTASAAGAVLLRHRDRVYSLSPVPSFRGDFANVYRAVHDGSAVAIKVARRAADNDLLTGERTVLRRIAREVEARYQPFFPRLVDSFAYQEEGSDPRNDPRNDPRATNVLTWVSDAYALDEIRRAYPRGVDAKDVAWIWRRLLVALGATHRAGMVHGAVLPPHVCVLPHEHGLVLIGWTCAVEVGQRIPAIGSAYEGWYPQEVMAKEPATAATDIAMGARCMLFLLGEDTPAALSRFFRGCALPAPRQRSQDAWALLREFDELLARLWGPRRFRPFVVPAPCPR